MPKNLIKIVLVALGLLFCVSSAYAASNTFQNLSVWANQQKSQAENHIKDQLNNNVEVQMALLNAKANQLLSNSNNEIIAMGNQTKEKTSTTINSALQTYKDNLQQTANEIEANSQNDMSQITEKIHQQTKKWSQSIEEAELDNLAFQSLDTKAVNEQKEQSQQQLQEEIDLTIATIEQLDQLKESESNAHVKEYIQRKIDFLNDLIVLLNESHSKDNE
ncbi:hypothetical protein [Pseudoneobacillus sp. C159]